jgi:flagellar basal-body rod modification protein FlgD
MSVSSVSSSQASTASQSSSNASMDKLSSNYTMFLQLLTTQLKNQSPLDPMDADQFTSQLVQYSSVEQLIKMNTNFEGLKTSLESSNLASLVNYVGSNVTVDASTKTLTDGKITWPINAEKSATATITVKDAAGKTVYSKSDTIDAGDNTFTWNGKGDDGTTYTAGDYTISVSATTASGAKVKTTTDVSGVVDSLEWADGTPFLMIGGEKYSTAAVTKIARSN